MNSEMTDIRERVLTITQEPLEDMTTPKTDRIMRLITSQKALSDAEIDRKARLDELEAIKILHRREVYTTNGATPEQDVINIRDRIAQLSTEDVKDGR